MLTRRLLHVLVIGCWRLARVMATAWQLLSGLGVVGTFLKRPRDA
jgi:hypothetical protein